MAKNIILLSDGTGNAAAKVWKTNVWRLYQALDLSDPEQVALYDDGVGTSSFKPLAILGGALGYGLKRNVLNLYSFLCRNYERGDRIYCFGFSRGAYTVRVVAAMVAIEGLVPWRESESELRRNAKAAYRAYRYRFGRLHPVVLVLRLTRDLIVKLRNIVRGYPSYREVKRRSAKPRIHFLGLWDTVDAYGLPLDEMTRAIHLVYWPLEFPNRDLHPSVRRACHALSLDDERTTFHPVLWNEQRERQVSSIKRERLSQVWFAGVHGNVGGGYPDDGLAHVSLEWIMDEAARYRLRFKPDARRALEQAADQRGRMYDSRHGLAGYYRYGPRRIEYLSEDTVEKVIIRRPKIHESVLQRIAAGTEGYAPIGLPPNYAVVIEDGRILDGRRHPYEHTPLSQWRAAAQEKVWDIVWFKRVVYFLTLAATLYLAAFPCLHGKVCDSAYKSWPWLETAVLWLSDKFATAIACVRSILEPYSTSIIDYLFPKIEKIMPWVTKAVAFLLPDSAAPWIKVFEDNPDKFFVGLLVVILLTLLGASLQRRIFERMRRIWTPIMENGPTKVPAWKAKRSILTVIRTSWLYRRGLLALKRTILPLLFAALYAYLIWIAGKALWNFLWP